MGFIYLAVRLACLARQWIKERSISCFFVKCGVHIFSGSFGSSGSPVHLRTWNNLYCVKCGVHVFSGLFGSSGLAVDQRTKYKLFFAKCGVHIFTGLFGSSGSAVHLRTRNNLYCVKCGVHVFSGSFGSSGSAVDQRTKYFPLPSQTSRLVWSMVKSGPAFCSLAQEECLACALETRRDIHSLRYL